jgi:hypothetical protein
MVFYRLVNALEFLLHRGKRSGMYNASAVKGAEADGWDNIALLVLPIFGIIACAQHALSDEIIRRLGKLSVGFPDFSVILEFNLVESNYVRYPPDLSMEERICAADQLKNHVRNEIARMRKVFDDYKIREKDFEAEAPDEFLDSLTGQLMSNPVKLPSAQYVDVTTIERLRATKAMTDPYTGAPLLFDSFSIDAERKAQVDAWRETKLR